MIYKLDETDSKRNNEYRDFVKKTPNGVVTQDPKWANVKSNWGRLFLYHLNDTDEIDAIMSILFIEAVEGGTLAYASKGPLVADFSDVSLVDEFIKKAIEELPENTFLIRMDPEVEYSDELNKLYQDAGFVTRNTQFEHMHSNIQPRKNMIFSFEGMTSQDEVFMSYQPDTRNYIRKSGEVSTIVGNSSELMKTFYELHKMMAEYHGISYRPENYFLTIQENFPNVEELQIFLTSTTEGTPVEASVATNFGNKSWLMYAGMNRRYAKTNATYQNRDFWLKFEFQKGLEYADFGGIQSETKEDGLYVAKKKFLRNQPVTVYIGEIDKVLDQTKYQEYLKRFDA